MSRRTEKNPARPPRRRWPARLWAERRNRVLLAAGLAVALVAGVWAARSWMREREVHGSVLKIGAVLPQTGPGAVFAQYIEEGINLAVEEINARGGTQVRVLYEDSKNQPREGVTAYNKLVSTEGPPVVVVALSSVAKALAPLAEQSRTTQVYVAVAIPDITDGLYTFRVYPKATGMAGVMAQFSVERLNARTAAVLYINDDFGRVSLEAYKAKFEGLGGRRVTFADSYELQQTDFRALISKLKFIEPAPDVIYLSGYGSAYGALTRQLREQKLRSQLTADVTMGLPDTLEQAGGAAEGVYFVDGKVSESFSAKFRGRYGKEPSSYAGYAYDIVNLIYETGRGPDWYTAESVSRGLLGVKDYQGAMGPISIGSKGDSDLQFVVKRVVEQVGTRVPD